MDLHAASRLAGTRWKLTKLAALLCFLVAGGLLVMSLSGITRARADLGASPTGLAIEADN